MASGVASEEDDLPAKERARLVPVALLEREAQPPLVRISRVRKEEA